MPVYYRGSVVTKELWDKLTPEEKKMVKYKSETEEEEVKTVNSNANVKGLYVVKDQYGIDKATARPMVLIRCELEKTSIFYCYASCKSFDMKTVEPKDFKMEFLSNADYNTIHVPYNKDLFQGLLDTATEVFLEIMENEKSSAAV